VRDQTVNQRTVVDTHHRSTQVDDLPDPVVGNVQGRGVVSCRRAEGRRNKLDANLDTIWRVRMAKTAQRGCLQAGLSVKACEKELPRLSRRVVRGKMR
jgi:hypothetical protein